MRSNGSHGGGRRAQAAVPTWCAMTDRDTRDDDSKAVELTHVIVSLLEQLPGPQQKAVLAYLDHRFNGEPHGLH